MNNFTGPIVEDACYDRRSHSRRLTVTHSRWIVYFLRFIAVCQMLAFAAIFLPINAWLPGWYSWLRLGRAPEVTAVLQYVIGATAFFQGAIGVWLWIMLSHVKRYRPLLAATAVIYLLAVPVFYYIDATAGLPFWWSMYDCFWCLAVGAALLRLCLARRSLTKAARQSTPYASQPEPDNPTKAHHPTPVSRL
jgi:hypothetical protein